MFSNFSSLLSSAHHSKSFIHQGSGKQYCTKLMKEAYNQVYFFGQLSDSLLQKVIDARGAIESIGKENEVTYRMLEIVKMAEGLQSFAEVPEQFKTTLGTLVNLLTQTYTQEEQRLF